jgi:hypothetical protein
MVWFCLCSNLSLIVLLSLANPVYFPAILFSYDEFYCNTSICTYVANNEVVLLCIRDILGSNLGRRPVIPPENCGSYLTPSMDMYEVVLYITSQELSVITPINLLINYHNMWQYRSTFCYSFHACSYNQYIIQHTINISSNTHTPW